MRPVTLSCSCAIALLCLSTRLDAAPDKVTANEWQNMPWTATGGILLYGASAKAAHAGQSADAGFLGVGGRIGVRRWLTPNLIGTALVEYGFLTWVNKLDDNGLPADTGKRWRTSHCIALLGRLELASFARSSRLLSIPEFSFYPVAGPVIMLGGGPRSGAGYRLGVGLGGAAGSNYSFSLDLSFQHLFFDEMTLKTALFSLGVLAF